MSLGILNQAGLDLIKTCQIRNVIDPLLAYHVVRETDHFLQMVHFRGEVKSKATGRNDDVKRRRDLFCNIKAKWW